MVLRVDRGDRYEHRIERTPKELNTMSPLEMIIILALVGYAIYRQTRTTEIIGQHRFKLALIYSIVGVVIGVSIPHHGVALGFLALSLGASLVVGLIRGLCTRVWRDDEGRVFTRGTVFTVGMFLALVAFKFVLGYAAYLANVPYDGSFGEILLMVGLMVGVQAEIVWRRARRLPGGARQPLVREYSTR
jgi:hypothetical protein